MEALQARLRDDLEDEQTWLVYADWLTDQGDMRGELVRISLQLGKKPPSRERRSLEQRAKAIREAHREVWDRGLPKAPELSLYHHHGFVTSVDVRWSEAAPALLQELLAHPAARLLTRLSLTGDYSTQALETLAQCSALRVFRTLDLSSYYLHPAHLEPLLRSPHLALRSLHLGGRHRGDLLAEQVAQIETLGSLRELGLEDNQLSAKGLSALARSPFLRELRVLSLDENALSSEGASALASADWGELRVLSLSETELRDEGAQILADSGRFRSLTELDLGGTRLSDEGVAALADSGMLQTVERLFLWRNEPLARPSAAGALRVLHLARNSLRDRGTAALIRAAWFPGLLELHLEENAVTGKGLAPLLQLDKPCALVSWNLDSNSIGDAGAGALGQARTLGALQRLSLWKNGIGPVGAAALARSTMPALRDLVLSDNPIGSQGAASLAQADLGALETLSLAGTRVGRKGAAALARAPGLGALEELSFRGQEISEEDASAAGTDRVHVARYFS
jgi:uncharacterized protein (TIGR02996 family)